MLFFNVKKQRKVIPVNTVPTVLHFRPDYESTETHQGTHNQIVQQSACVRIRVKSWREFIDAIRENRPDFITIHQSVIDLEHNSVEEFSSAVQLLIQYIPKNRHTETVPVAIGIEPNSTQQFVKQLQQAGFAGIWPTATSYGAQACVFAMQAFLSNQEYWPADIVDQLPSAAELPISVYFCEDHGTYITETMVQQLKKHARCQVHCCTDWSDLGRQLKNKPHQLVFHISMLDRLDTTVSEIITMLEVVLKLSHLDIPIAVGIDPTTPVSVIRELKRAGVFGLVPSAGHWGTEATVTALNALVDRVPHWPRHILDQLPGNKPVVEKAVSSSGQLTARQQEVMDLICRRGLSNKQIARSLKLSESTVKIHVSAVMKVYGVRNRTQLALSAGTGLTA